MYALAAVYVVALRWSLSFDTERYRNVNVCKTGRVNYDFFFKFLFFFVLIV